MLKNKNILPLVFLLAAIAFFIVVSPDDISSSGVTEVIPEEEGKVLGVSEEISEEQPKNYLAVEELEKIIPVVDKSSFKPIRKEGSGDPVLTWGAVLAKDVNSQELLYKRESDEVRSVASITKLVTALVLMDQDMDWESYYEIKAGDKTEGGRVYVYEGEKILLKDLLYTSLVASANTATRALVSASGLSYDEFIEAMNKKAEDLGLEKTKFVDPIGLSPHNVSTAEEIAVIAEEVLESGVIRECLRQEKYVYKTAEGKSKTVHSTNILLDNFPGEDINILGGKTGFTGAAGYCFVGLFEGNNKNPVVTVILGSSSHGSRFSDTEKLINWVYGNHVWVR